MNIVQIPRRFVRNYWGGTETVILETGKCLQAMGHNTEVICSKALAEQDATIIEGIKVKRVPYFYPYWGLRDQAKRQLDLKGGNLFSFALLRALQQYPALDLIHLHTMKRVGGIGRYVAREKRIPYVVTVHGGLFDVPLAEAQSWTAPTSGTIEWGKVLGWWVGSRRVLDDAAAVICVDQKEQVEIQRRLPQQKVLHLPCGVNWRRFRQGDGDGFRRHRNISQKACVILTVGRIDPQKNQLALVCLLPELIKEVPNAHLLFIGPVTNEVYYTRLSQTIQDEGMQHHVTVIPGLDPAGQALIDAYHAADLFLLPSIHEPFGAVILEAWAAGLPVLASRVGGIPSFVVDGQDGMLIDATNGRTLREGIQALLQDRQRMQALAQAGQSKARAQFGWERITERLVEVYQEAVRENPLCP